MNLYAFLLALPDFGPENVFHVEAPADAPAVHALIWDGDESKAADLFGRRRLMGRDVNVSVYRAPQPGENTAAVRLALKRLTDAVEGAHLTVTLDHDGETRVHVFDHSITSPPMPEERTGGLMATVRFYTERLR